ncbi:MAG: helix-turn-helix domain-containing protein [Sphingomonadales bacterium]|nr:helix-turn-helix domain-containing protein [Sphingomonadales bacterium]
MWNRSKIGRGSGRAADRSPDPYDVALCSNRPADRRRLLRKSRRTLQRRLTAHGTSFADIFVRVRASLALLYLRESSLTVAESAEILQFSQTSALSRFMTRTSGKSPRQIRNNRPVA